MTDTPNPFEDGDNTTTQTPATPDTSTNNPFADKLNKIVNDEGKPKYKDVETALDALDASQKFIEQLKREKREAEEKEEAARRELEKIGSIEDFVKRIKPNTEPLKTDTTTTGTEYKGLSEDQVAKLLEQKLNERSNAERAKQNLAAVNAQLVKMFGDQAVSAVKQKAEELGTTPSDLENMAKSNPKMVLALFGGSSKTSTTPSQSTHFGTMQPKEEPLRIEKGKGPIQGGMSTRDVTDLFKKSASQTRKRLGLEG